MSLPFPVAKPTVGYREAELVSEALRKGQLSCGPMVEEFERRFAREVVGGCHAVATCNGTAALELALLAVGVKRGERVVVPALTYGATANAVIAVGAVPRFVDVDVETWMLPADFDAEGDAAIVVHLYGGVCPSPKNPRWVVEDAAEAPGARVRVDAVGFDAKVGTLGSAAAFSFFGNKPIACGEGGMMTTTREEVAERARLLRGQGQSPERRYWHLEPGRNFRMTELQAAVGLAQLERFEEDQRERRRVVERYERNLKRLEVRLNLSWERRAYWLFACLVPSWVDRDEVAHELAGHGIETRPMFPPLPEQPAFERFAKGQQFPAAGIVARSGIVLPTYAGLTDSHVDWISGRVLHACRLL